MDVFGDPSLFAEFEKPDEPSDRILKERFKEDLGSRIAASKEMIPHEVAYDENDADSEANSEEPTARFEVGDSPRESEDDDASRGGHGSENGYPPGGRTLHGIDPDDDYAMHSSERSGFTATQRRELRDVKFENERLRLQCRVVDPTVHVQDGSGPAVEVLFMNQDFARIFKSDIENYITSCIDQYKQNRQPGLPPITLRSSNIALSQRASRLLSEDALKYIEASTVLNCSHFYDEFVVDSLGWPLVESTPSLTDSWFIPNYEQPFTEPLPVEAEDVDVNACPQPERQKRPKNVCFNCEEEHRISECPYPKDAQRINENRRKFQTAMANMPARQVRYHDDASSVPKSKYDVYKPGVLSDELRDALGLRANQLPPYVYQMRVLGYPPGWLEEARMATSGLALFGKGGEAIANSSDIADVEDGEIDDLSQSSEKYDVSRLVDFPGFNVPVPDGVMDECEQVGMPPMLPQHDKSILALKLTPQPSRTKRLLSNDSTGQEKKKQKTRHNDTITDSIDMDISLQDAPGTPGSLEDLEMKKKELQRQLTLQLSQTGSESGELTPDGMHAVFTPPAPPTPDRPPLPPGTPPLTPQTSGSHSSFDASTPRSGSICVNLGTPIVSPMASKKDSLPEPGKWADGISEHIPFENLPGATGTFEKMRTLFKRIKTVVKK